MRKATSPCAFPHKAGIDAETCVFVSYLDVFDILALKFTALTDAMGFLDEQFGRVLAKYHNPLSA